MSTLCLERPQLPLRHGCAMRDNERMNSSDSEAQALLRELYDSHASALRAFVLRLTGGDWQRAEDVVQETLLRAWRNADKLLSEPARLRPWLVTVARRIVIDEHRGKVARPPEVGFESVEGLPATTGDASDAVVTAIAVAQALRTLSPAHRHVLIETYFRDRTTQETALALQLPVGTVKSRVYYALRSLRQTLVEQEVTS